ncbi:MAG: hypothetical protein KME13_23945 [Myxacorys californica WJT36-NPBG1]|nr:hypothetical protein [Myxacorys californica WJT36-NPBG1]
MSKTKVAVVLTPEMHRRFKAATASKGIKMHDVLMDAVLRELDSTKPEQAKASSL